MRDDTTDDQTAAGVAEEAVPAILVASGPAAVSLLTGMLVTVLGDATNVAFRLSGLAGRDGRPDVLVTDTVHRTTSASFAFTAPSAIRVKGRMRAAEALGASRSPEGQPAS